MQHTEKEMFDMEQRSLAYSDMIEMKRKAIKKVMFDIYVEEFRAKLENGAEAKDAYEEVVMADLRTRVKNTRNIAARGWWWITFTINASLFSTSDEYLPRLMKKVDKANSKKCVGRSMWSYELTKEGVPHCHYLLELSEKELISKDKLFKGFQNTFKDVGYVKIKNCPPEWVKDKVLYLKGEKWDEDKDEMVAIDRDWRKTVGLQPYYEKGEWGDVLDAPPTPSV